MFVDAFAGSGAQAQISTILYSGPKTWGGVWKCIGRNTQNVDIENVCNIKTVNHFGTQISAVKAAIGGLQWPKGSTLTSMAIMKANAELQLGRDYAKGIIVVITDGRPLSYYATSRASRFVRKSARLVWVAVTRYAPLRKIKHWATQRWQENVVVVHSFADLETPTPVNQVLADICPQHDMDLM